MAEVFLTLAGKKELEEKIRYLKEVERPKITEQLKEARAQGDLSENADYDAIRNKQSICENQIHELETTLQNAIIIDKEESKASSVSLGSLVLIELVSDHSTREYRIVGSIEADPLKNKISNECPLAQAIIGHKVGETITVNAKHKYDVIIKKISF